MSNRELKEKLSELAKSRENSQETVSCIEDHMDTLIIHQVLKDFPKIRSLDIYCPFDGKCKKSPFGFCVYDESTEDNCLYCKKSHDEREEP